MGLASAMSPLGHPEKVSQMSKSGLPQIATVYADIGVDSRSYAPTHTIADHGYAGDRCTAEFRSSLCRSWVP
jgi:hypothetical protein